MDAPADIVDESSRATPHRGDTPGRRRLVAADPTRDTVWLPGPGTLLDDRYLLEAEIGRGGMGVVYRAFDEKLETGVAVKILPPELAHSKRAVADLKREAVLAMGLRHPRIMALYGFGEADTIKYLVMELLEGCSLDDRLGEVGSLPLDEVVRMASELADALDYAHRERVAHRDIKPANVFLHRRGGVEEVRLTDFGIARQMKDSLSRVSRQEAAGTLLYMSPEQLQGTPADERSDVYSLAATLYECLAGHAPFHTGSISFQILQSPVKPIPGVPAYVNEALRRGLAKDPAERPESAGLLARALGGEPLPPLAELPAPGPPASAGPARALSLVVVLLLLALGTLLMPLRGPARLSVPEPRPPLPSLAPTPIPSPLPPTPPPTLAPEPAPTPETPSPSPEPDPEPGLEPLPPPVTEPPAPPSPTPDEVLGRCRTAMADNDTSRLLIAVRDATTLDPAGAEGLVVLIGELSSSGRLDTAARLLGELPSPVQTAERWLALGLQAFDTNDAALASNAFTKAWTADPSTHEAYYHLALICEANPAKLDRAEDYIGRALELRPTRPEYLALRDRLAARRAGTVMPPPSPAATAPHPAPPDPPAPARAATGPIDVTLRFVVAKRGNQQLRRVEVAVTSCLQDGPSYLNLRAVVGEKTMHRRSYSVRIPNLVPGTYNVAANISGVVPVYGMKMPLLGKRVSWPNVIIQRPGDVLLEPEARTE